MQLAITHTKEPKELWRIVEKETNDFVDEETTAHEGIRQLKSILGKDSKVKVK